VRPHQRLLTWLSRRSQCVVLNDISSHQARVQSGAPQGTDPLMFILYINNILIFIHPDVSAVTTSELSTLNTQDTTTC